MSTTAENTAALRAGWRGFLCTSAQEVFSGMVGFDLTASPESRLPVIAHVTGMVWHRGRPLRHFHLALQ
jgi:hypothetical protein